MRLLAPLVATLGAFATLIAAQAGTNSVNVPPGGLPAITAGKPATFTWSNKAGSTVTITLRNGNGSALNKGTVIVSKTPNTGSITFTPSADTVQGSDYTLEITNDDTGSSNFSPVFTVNSDVKTSASASASSAASTASSASAASSASSASTASTASVTSSASAESKSASSSKSSSETKTGSSTGSHSATGSATATSSGVTSVPTGAAAAPTVFAPGILAAVAVGVAAAL